MFDELSAAAAVRQERVGVGCRPTLAIHFVPVVIAGFAPRHSATVVRVYDNRRARSPSG